jgi:hypothetical protein
MATNSASRRRFRRVIAMILLYEWEVIVGFDAAEHIGPCGVTDSEPEARKRLTQALLAAPTGAKARGRITIVVLRFDRPEGDYERGRRVALANREARGPIRWTAADQVPPAPPAPSACSAPGSRGSSAPPLTACCR